MKTDWLAEQRKWIAEHGGNLPGYLNNYGQERGAAIYDADIAELERLEHNATRNQARRGRD